MEDIKLIENKTLLETQGLLNEFCAAEDQEIQEALEETFQINGTKLQTDLKEGEYVFFSLTCEGLKSFINTLQTVAKCTSTSVYTLKFTDRGFHQCEILDEEKKKVATLHWQVHFFHLYRMEPGMEVEVPIHLEKFLPQLTVGRRKGSSDVVYFVCSNAGLATWTINRGHEATTPGFCPRVEKKGSKEDLLNETPPFLELQITEPQVVFKQVSERISQIISSFGKEKTSQRGNPNPGNLLYIRYNEPKGELSLSPSEAAFNQGKFTRFKPHVETPKKDIQFKGTFNSSIVSSFCKLSPVIFMGLSNEPTPTLHLKTYYRELSEPSAENSYFEIQLVDESMNVDEDINKE